MTGKVAVHSNESGATPRAALVNPRQPFINGGTAAWWCTVIEWSVANSEVTRRNGCDEMSGFMSQVLAGN